MVAFSISWNMVLGFVSALIVSYIMIPPLVRISRAKYLVAMPNGRTSHNGAVPTLGGVAIFTSVVVGVGLFLPDDYPKEFQFLVPSLIVMFIFGMQDDINGIRPTKKLAGQIVSSLIVIIGANVRMTTLHGLFGIEEIWYPVSVFITLVIFVGLINSFNLVDGIDGLASGLGITISLQFGIWLTLFGSGHYALLAFALTGSLVAFYCFNVFSKKNKLFMGDTGSMIIGLIFSTTAIKLLSYPVTPDSYLYMKAFPVVVMSLMIIPVSDTLRVMVQRVIRRRNPFYADRTHCHHDLLVLGFSHWQASTIIIMANLSLFFFALILRGLPIYLLGIIMLGTGVFFCSIPRIWIKRILKLPDEPETHPDLQE